MTKRTLAAALCVTLTLAACGGGGSEGADRPELPRSLDAIEAQAEDIIDVVPAGKWDKVSEDVRSLDEAWRSYRSRAEADGARPDVLERLDAALAALKEAAEARKPAETMQAANDVSAPTVELYGLYDTGRPLDIGRLDVIGRQIIFDADRRDLTAAGAQVSKARAIWDGGLRADIVDHGGQKVARQTDDNLAAMEKSRSSGDFAALRHQANDFLEIVDAMERLY